MTACLPESDLQWSWVLWKGQVLRRQGPSPFAGAQFCSSSTSRVSLIRSSSFSQLPCKRFLAEYSRRSGSFILKGSCQCWASPNCLRVPILGETTACNHIKASTDDLMRQRTFLEPLWCSAWYRIGRLCDSNRLKFEEPLMSDDKTGNRDVKSDVNPTPEYRIEPFDDMH